MEKQQNKLSSAISLKRLFNLGLHLNNNKKGASWKDYQHTRPNNKKLLRNPLHMEVELNLFIRMLSKLLQAGGKIAIINNGPELKKGIAGLYGSLFEGVNVSCFEEEWMPGTFTNPIHGYEIPDLVIYLSAQDKDKAIILSEITNLRIPLFNFSLVKYNHSLAEFSAAENPTKVFFFMQLLLYWIQAHEIRELPVNKEHVKENEVFLFEKKEVKGLFESVVTQKLIFSEKKTALYSVNRRLSFLSNNIRRSLFYLSLADG